MSNGQITIEGACVWADQDIRYLEIPDEVVMNDDLMCELDGRTNGRLINVYAHWRSVRAAWTLC